MSVGPYDPGGSFSWTGADVQGGSSPDQDAESPGTSCSCVSVADGAVTFGCTPSCDCGGSCVAIGTFSFAGAVFGVAGGVCRCGFEDPGEDEHPPVEYPVTGGVSVSCSAGAVIFEDAYQDSPGVWKPKKSTRMRLKVSAWGGEHGGTLVLNSENLGKLSPVACGPLVLPPSTPLRPGQDFSLSFICEAAEESGNEGDIKVHGRFYENETGNVKSNDVELTSIKVELRVEQQAPGNSCVNRHSYGVFELVECHSTLIPIGGSPRWSVECLAASERSPVPGTRREARTWRRKSSISDTPAGMIAPPSFSVWTMGVDFMQQTKHAHSIQQTSAGQFPLDGVLQNGTQ